jgi:hypothetical protein
VCFVSSEFSVFPLTKIKNEKTILSSWFDTDCQWSSVLRGDFCPIVQSGRNRRVSFGRGIVDHPTWLSQSLSVVG